MSEEGAILTCPNCNEPLEAGWPRCPVCRTPTSSSGLMCPSCQAPIKPNWNECPHCRIPLSGQDTPSSGVVHPRASSHYSDESRVYVSQEDGEPGGIVGDDLPLPLAEGEILADRYRAIKRLGQGGYGAVYHVFDTVLSEQMALKIVKMGHGKAERATEQLLHEFSLREKIDNTEHIVKAYDPRPCPFKNLALVILPMELADGGSLRQWLTQNKDVEKRRTIGIEFFKQACRGVKAIHSAGLAHLDIKPENILMVGGKAKIADFGIGRFGASRLSDNPDQLLRQGIGTPHYMSPEQVLTARQKDIGPVSDIYSLGVVLFEILDGHLPFDGTVTELRHKHLNMEPPALKGGLEKWSRIVQCCLAKKPENRYQDVEHLIGDVDRAVQGLSLSVDVSCPKCGHINVDTSHDICEKCGLNLPDTIFQECCRCLKKLRLDTEVCPGCGFHVMAYHVLQDRWGRVQKLKDEDPVGAMELLEVLLHDGAGEHEDAALKLVRELRKKQSQISGVIAEAEKAVEEGELENAVKAWRAVLKVIPRHRKAQEQIETLQSTLQQFADHLGAANTLMDEGQFESADGHLQKCLELIPKRERARSMLNSCRRRGQEYTEALSQARECARQKLILKANQYVEAALAQAEKSSESMALADELAGTLEKTKGLADQARNRLSRAEFGKVYESIREIELQQADNKSVSELKGHLNEIQDSYVASMRNTRLAASDHDLGKASDAVERALELCPESSEAKSLLKQLSKDRGKALDLLEEAKSLMPAAKFSDAEILLEQVQGLWPMVEDLDETKELLAKTRLDYEEYMQRCHQAKASKVLDDALREAELACGVCPQSTEAKTLLEAVQEGRTRVHKWLKEAVSYTNAARFDEANTRLLQVEDLWIDASGVAGAQEELVRAREQYPKAMVTAREALAQKDMAKALHATETATSICPESKKALALVKSIEKDQLAATDHLRMAEDACKAAEFEKALNELSRAEEIWPAVPGLREAMANLLAARKTLRRRKIKWGIMTAVVLVSVYLFAKLVLILANRQYANAAIRHANKGDYVTAIREYYKCHTIPLLVSLPLLPENVREPMEAADRRRKEQFASVMSQAENLFSKGQIEQAESVTNKALELAVTGGENRQINILQQKISDAVAQRKHDALVAKAQAEVLLAKRIKMLEEALSNKVTLSTRQLLQSAIAEQNRMPKIGDTITNSIDMELAYIPQGEFIMGSSEKKDEAPQHKVTISKGFYMGVCEVTQSQYKAIMGSNPSGHKKWLRGGGLPVECVSWDEATTFCNELGRRENRTYRLPTEAEWEYACRAGRSGTLFSFGNGSMISEYAWFKRNSDAETHATGKKKPNAFGLYDMHGNVNEWCSDWYDDHYPTTDDQIDPQGPTTGSFRVLRGGSYNCSSTECRSAWRIYSTPYEKTYSFGFRVVLEPK